MKKLLPSLAAMFFGWIACNAFFALHVMLTNAQPFDSQRFLTEMLAIGIYSGIVIFVAWLVVFWPVDVMVPDHSRLRRPVKAAVCGFLAVLLPYYSIMIGYCLLNDLIHSWTDFAPIHGGSVDKKCAAIHRWGTCNGYGGRIHTVLARCEHLEIAL